MNRLNCLRRGVALIGLGLCNLASAAVFTYENPAYTFELYSTGSTGFVGQTFTADGRLLRSTGGNGLYVHSATADTTINGTNTIHSAVLTSITGLGGGYGMTTGLDGKLYAMTTSYIPTTLRPILTAYFILQVRS